MDERVQENYTLLLTYKIKSDRIENDFQIGGVVK